MWIPPNHLILIGFSTINHPLLGTPHGYGNHQMIFHIFRRGASETSLQHRTRQARGAEMLRQLDVAALCGGTDQLIA